MTSREANLKLADELYRLCCAETEGKFFDCVTDNIDTILAALRSQAGKAEPVAWQWRYIGDREWRTPTGGVRLTDSELKNERPIEQRPLYAQSPPKNDTWQPIETAPKDGTQIIVCGDYSDDVAIVRWDARKKDWLCLADGMAVIESQDDFRTDLLFFSVPSHWQPCPIARRTSTLSREEGSAV